MERIGIYGGTFNPPHIGHMQAAQQAIDLLSLDRLLLIPAAIAPHKQLPTGSGSAQQRLEMLTIAAKDLPKTQVLDLELRREGLSYTYLTVEELSVQYPRDELVLIMGSDMFLSFDSWKNWEQITQHASLGVLYRGNRDEKAAVAKKKEQLSAQGVRVELAENRYTAISSTDIRRMLVFGCGEGYLPEGVADYIREKRLYVSSEGYRGLSLKQLENVVMELLKPNRRAHVAGCRDTAVELAKRWGADETDAARAGLLHDVTKALDGPLQLTLCQAYGKILDDFSRKYPKTLHALTGSLVAERIFGENDAVISAIRHHTTGRADMTLLEKIIYVADYMEPNRNFPGVQVLRELAYTDIDAALKQGLEFTLEHLARQGSEVSPESREALAWLNSR